eukprot:CAMPEP_0113444340 /NCGR_PEP_ID=MMETSP0014_2-20120614/2616_1 /TAXON_ID=2857 /ORGANISM="Nitzschia sp." /LENGTH=545 /DNA_ID=CAMNT_0000335349 /DNA_START=74 /DNA_END=1711 /DNA_ORIENTATION=+ /assembly_acc=CAM_ASM_000159
MASRKGRSTRIKQEMVDNDDDVAMSSADADPNADQIGSTLSGGPSMIQSTQQYADNDDDGSDHVVQEIPVYLSPELSQRLHLIQYPLQVSSRTSSQSAPSSSSAQPPNSARIKPRHCQLEVEFPLPNDGTMNDQGLYAMENRTFESHTIPVSTHLALGMLLPVTSTSASSGTNNNNTPNPLALHLVPLSRITQLRPSFGHVDQEENIEEATDGAVAELINDESARKPIAITKKESERAVLARRSSYAFRKSSIESEPWQNLEVHNVQSDQATGIIETQIACPQDQQMVSLSSSSAAASASMNSASRYVRSLNYMPKEAPPSMQANALTPLSANNNTDHTTAKTTSDDDHISSDDPAVIVRRLVRLLHQGWPTPYSILRSHFPEEMTDDSLFVALGSCAVLVQGNFCLSSKLMPFSSTELSYARSFMLFLFQTLRVVHRQRLEHVFSSPIVAANATSRPKNGGKKTDSSDDKKISTLSPEAIHMLLEQVGRPSRNAQGTGQGWVLKVDEDTTFSERYPEASIVHNQYWELQANYFEPLLQRYREDI